MRSENLKWVGSVELLVGDIYLDLHNCFDFVSFQHDVRKRELTLIWRKGTGDWVDASLPGHLTICFYDVFHLAVRPRDAQMPFSEDDCLEDFGFYESGKTDKGPFFGVSEIDPNWLWSFAFQSRAEIVVGAQLAAATLSS